MKKLQTLYKTAKQVKNLLSAVSEINNNECPLSISQIKRLIDGGEPFQQYYINKYQGGISFNKPIDESLYICINITWVDDDKYIIGIK